MYLNLVDNAFIIQTLAVMNPYVFAIFVLFAMLVPHRRETGHTDRGRGGGGGGGGWGWRGVTLQYVFVLLL